MTPPDRTPDAEREALAKLLQEELAPIEPAPEVREAIFKRILRRTVQAWQVLGQRLNGRRDDGPDD